MPKLKIKAKQGQMDPNYRKASFLKSVYLLQKEETLSRMKL